MARTKGAKAANKKPHRKGLGPRAYLMKRGLRVLGQPIFTETFKLPNSTGQASPLLPNAGFLLTANIGNLPQITQYSGLYQKYRILKATFLLLPTYSGGENQNASIFNAVSGPGLAAGGVSSAGSCRIVHVIDNSPNQTTPTSEDAVLQENGCKIRMATNMLRMSCRPVPDIKDSNSNAITMKGKYLNFNQGSMTPEIPHFGIRGWITHPFTVGGTGFAATDALTFACYVKLTFQVAEPR